MDFWDSKSQLSYLYCKPPAQSVPWQAFIDLSFYGISIALHEIHSRIIISSNTVLTRTVWRISQIRTARQDILQFQCSRWTAVVSFTLYGPPAILTLIVSTADLDGRKLRRRKRGYGINRTLPIHWPSVIKNGGRLLWCRSINKTM